MNRRIVQAVALGGLLAAVGCMAASNPDSERSPGRGSGTVITPEHPSNTGSTVLTLIQARFPGMQVRRGGGSCVDLEFRGRMSLTQSVQPAIYVQGQRSANTCILEMLNVTDVERIEVYPHGQATLAGYRGTAGGLILIFLKDGV